MKQFDVFTNPAGEDAASRPHLVLLSSHLIDLDVVLVAPLLSGRTRAVPVAELEVNFDGRERILALLQVTAVRRGLLRRRAGSIASCEAQIRRGLERLFTGF